MILGPLGNCVCRRTPRSHGLLHRTSVALSWTLQLVTIADAPKLPKPKQIEGAHPKCLDGLYHINKSSHLPPRVAYTIVPEDPPRTAAAPSLHVAF